MMSLYWRTGVKKEKWINEIELCPERTTTGGDVLRLRVMLPT